MDGEVELLLPVSLEHKAKCQENINKQKQTNQSPTILVLWCMHDTYKQLPVHVKVTMSAFPKTSVSAVLMNTDTSEFLRIFTLEGVFKNLCFQRLKTLFAFGWEAKTQRKNY